MIELKSKFAYIAVRWLILFAFLISVLGFAFFSSRNLILVNAKSDAEAIMLNAADTAAIEVLKEENITYDDIAVISRDSNGKILGIEIDSVKADIIKSKLSLKTSEILKKNSNFKISIPLGNFLSNDYTSGLGPDLKFDIQMTNTASLDFESNFKNSSINNTLHQILINLDISANIVIKGGSDAFKVKTSIIVAQTVISGEVPDSFTNVTENPGDDIADDIFNFAR